MITWQKTSVASKGTHHLIDNLAFYPKRFTHVLKYHAPGIASVLDESGAYHINMQGEPCYTKRYIRTFGFYQELAAVIDHNGWRHIKTDGTILYLSGYLWCGNYQNNYCAVKDKDHNYFHIDLLGKPLYLAQYAYAGDYKDGIATVQNQNGLYTHINTKGEFLHNKWFEDLDIFHKGLARAKDITGWFHINLRGKAVYNKRFRMVEPFYNGFARVEDDDEAICIIDESGNVIDTLRNSKGSLFSKLSAELVGYWKTYTIKSAVDLEIFDNLPGTLDKLANIIGLDPCLLKRLLRALMELELILFDEQKKNYKSSEKGKYLAKKHPMSLTNAALHWSEINIKAWPKLTESLKAGKSLFLKEKNDDWFTWFSKDSKRLQRYQRMLKVYAKQDYQEIAHKFDYSNHKTVIDAAGGEGVLLSFILKEHSHLKGILLEKSEVVEHCNFSGNLPLNCHVYSFDLFEKWPVKADLIFLSRVLHDWNDQTAVSILTRAKDAILPNGQLCLVEMVLDETSANAGLLDMNMFIETNGKERTYTEFQKIVSIAGLKLSNQILLSSGNSVLVIERS